LVTENTIVSRDVTNHTLYAKWTANTYTVSFDAQGGTVDPTSMPVTFGSAYGPLPIPIRQNCIFAGWWTGANGTGTQVTEATVVSTTANHTLRAKWVGTLAFSQASSSIVENQTSIPLIVTRTGSSTGSVTVQYTTANGTAIAGTDYTAKTGTLTFGSGVTSQAIAIPILNKDTVFTGDRNFTVTLSNPTGNIGLGTPATATVTIHDDDTASLRFSAVSYTVAENLAARVVTLTVNRSGGTGAASVKYATADGTAVAGRDYTAASGTVSLAAGQTSKTFTVPLINNTVVDGTRNFSVVLSDPGTGAALITPTTATVNITDDDKAGSIQFSATTASLKEDAGTVKLTVTRSNGLASGVTVGYATADKTALAGSDYTATSGTLTFGAGETSKTITVPVTPDQSVELNETFTVTLSNPTGGATLGTSKVATVTILNDDVTNGGAIQFSPTTYTVNEADGGVQLTVNRTGSGLLAGGVKVNLTTITQSGIGKATTGSDYTSLSTTLVFAEGETSKTVRIPIIDDSLVEPNESFTVKLSTPTSGATVPTAGATATVTIVSDDVGGTVQFSDSSYTVNESAGTATITVTRTGGAASAVSVTYGTASGTATSSSDYKPTSGVFTFAAGETTKTFTVPIVNDTLVEPNETVKLALSSVTGGATLGAPATATLTIIDNDGARQPFFAAPAGKPVSPAKEADGAVDFSQVDYSDTGTAADALGVPITVVRASGTEALTVNYSTEADSAIPGSDYTEVSGTLTFKEGETSKTFLVPVLKNPARKLPAAVILNLEDPENDNVISTATLWLFP
jgi:hypothetical protein